MQSMCKKGDHGREFVDKTYNYTQTHTLSVQTATVGIHPFSAKFLTRVADLSSAAIRTWRHTRAALPQREAPPLSLED